MVGRTLRVGVPFEILCALLLFWEGRLLNLLKACSLLRYRLSLRSAQRYNILSNLLK